jgi:hypothetical protein
VSKTIGCNRWLQSTLLGLDPGVSKGDGQREGQRGLGAMQPVEPECLSDHFCDQPLKCSDMVVAGNAEHAGRGLVARHNDFKDDCIPATNDASPLIQMFLLPCHTNISIALPQVAAANFQSRACLALGDLRSESLQQAFWDSPLRM